MLLLTVFGNGDTENLPASIGSLTGMWNACLTESCLQNQMYNTVWFPQWPKVCLYKGG